MTNRLCSVCEAIFRGRKIVRVRGLIYNGSQLHLRSLEQLYNGVDTGCIICILLAQYLASELGGLQHVTTFHSRYTLVGHDRAEMIEFRVGSADGGPWRSRLFPIGLLPLFPVLGTNPRRLCQPMSSTLDSTATVQLMQTWLRGCRECHQKCSQRGKDAQGYHLPTRLIDAGPPGTKECRVIRTDSGSVSRAYLTLSHRWGSSEFLQLNSRTIGTLTAGIPITELPATFRDAVFVAHQLDIRYLWIDSLCIQQDSRDDWIRESPNMQHVYGFATVNVVAGQSHGPEDGIFNPRESFLFDPFTFRFQLEPQTEVDYLLWDKSGLDDDFEFAPLTQRGWVFQERLLAPRILQFGKKQVYWRCSELFACETWPQGACSLEGEGLRLDTDLDGLDGNGCMEIQPLQNSADISRLFLSTSPVVRWEKLVIQYSCTELTCPEDKLVALSGVAKLFQQTLGGRYLAGLWWTPLERLLCWRRDDHKEREPRAKPKYRAPSWSWASIDGPIRFTTITRPHPLLWVEYLVRGVDAEVVPLSCDEMAQVKSGCIKVKARLRSIRVTTETRKVGSRESPNLRAEMGGKKLDQSFSVCIDSVLDDELDDLSLWVIPTLLLVEKQHDSIPFPSYVLEGLLLRETAVEPDTYERIGYFSCVTYFEGFEEFGISIHPNYSDGSGDYDTPLDWGLRVPEGFSVEFDPEIELCQTVTII